MKSCDNFLEPSSRQKKGTGQQIVQELLMETFKLRSIHFLQNDTEKCVIWSQITQHWLKNAMACVK